MNTKTGIPQSSGDDIKRTGAGPISGFFVELLSLSLVNVIVLMIFFIFSLLTSPITNELAARAGEGGGELVGMYKRAFCIPIQYAVLFFVKFLNSSERGRYISSTRGVCGGKSTGLSLKDTLCHALSYAVFCLPVYIIIFFIPDIRIIPTLFTAQYSLIELTGDVKLSYMLNIIIYTVFMTLLTPVVKRLWNSRRLHK